MQGKSHTIMNLVSAPFVDSFLRITGAPYLWSLVVTITNNPLLFAAHHSLSVLEKITFYGLVGLSARLPDLDQKRWIRRLTGGHRQFTHSILCLVLLSGVFFSIFVEVPKWLAAYSWEIQPSLLSEVKVAFEAIVIGWALHILADTFTKDGVPLFWPIPMRFGIPPFRALRFKSGTMRELVLLCMICIVASFCFAKGLIGL